MITVFTPTYNRCEELKRLYASLLAQSCGDFEWLIVDDGSTDETKSTVDRFISEKKVNIRYIYEENGGKMRAHNVGVKNAAGDFFVCVDSDDRLVENAVETFFSNCMMISDERLAGLVFLDTYIKNGDVVGSEFPKEKLKCSYYEIYEKFGVTGDKTPVFKTEVLKEFPFPEIPNEKFIPEAIVYNRISLKYDMLCLNIPIKEVEYLSDGYSSDYFSLVKKNPIGNSLYFRELYNFKPSFYNTYGYILFSLYAGRKFTQIYKEHKAKLKILLLYVPTLILSKLR